jgi:hypothetical protein
MIGKGLEEKMAEEKNHTNKSGQEGNKAFKGLELSR